MNPYMILGGPLPSSLGRLADLIHDTDEVRLAMQKEADAVAARVSELKEHAIAQLSKEGADSGASGLKYRVQRVDKTKYNVKDWGVLHSWIKKNDRFDMLQKRLSDKAVEDWVDAQRIEAEEKGTEARLLPGTERLTVPTLSITKIPGR